MLQLFALPTIQFIFVKEKKAILYVILIILAEIKPNYFKALCTQQVLAQKMGNKNSRGKFRFGSISHACRTSRSSNLTFKDAPGIDLKFGGCS